MHYSTKVPWLTRLLLIAAFCLIGLMSMSIKASDAHAQTNGQVPCLGSTYWTYISSFTENVNGSDAQFFTGVLAQMYTSSNSPCGNYQAASALKTLHGAPNGLTVKVCFYAHSQQLSSTCGTTSVSGSGIGEFWAVSRVISVFSDPKADAARGMLGSGQIENVPFVER